MKMICEIPGFEQFKGYGITSCGKVWSFKTNKFLKPSRDKRGYLRVKLTNGRKISKDVLIHRLVALAYVPNPDGLDTVDHLDENKEHNYVNNLRWMSRIENKKRSWCKPVKCIETEQVFESATIAAKEMNLDRKHISDICNGRGKTVHGYHFEFI